MKNFSCFIYFLTSFCIRRLFFVTMKVKKTAGKSGGGSHGKTVRVNRRRRPLNASCTGL